MKKNTVALYAPRFALHDKKGQSILAFMFLIGIMVVLAGITLIFFATSFLSSTTSFKLANRAELVAQAGIEDALLQLARNKDFSSSGYALAVASDTATISVTKDNPVTNKTTVSSTVSISIGYGGTRTIVAIVTRDTVTGQISVISLKQQ
jgi:uncharacterized protein (UPF0333 family)